MAPARWDREPTPVEVPEAPDPGPVVVVAAGTLAGAVLAASTDAHAIGDHIVAATAATAAPDFCTAASGILRKLRLQLPDGHVERRRVVGWLLGPEDQLKGRQDG